MPVKLPSLRTKPLNEGKNQRVVTKMSDTCHQALKMYAEAFHLNVGEVLYSACRMMFHKQAQFCDVVAGIFEECEIPLDKRADRECFGFSCMACKHQTACRTGIYKGVVEIKDEYLPSVNATGAVALSAMQSANGQESQDFPSLGEKPVTRHRPRVKQLKQVSVDAHFAQTLP